MSDPDARGQLVIFRRPVEDPPEPGEGEPPKGDPELLELLAFFRSRVEAGEVNALAIVSGTSDGCDGTAYCLANGSLGSLIVGTNRLLLRLLEHRE